jgi:hypothetical protein
MKTSQTGWLMIWIFFPILLLLSFLLYRIDNKEFAPLIILGSVWVIMLICLLIFHKLTIEVDDVYVRFWFGFGTIRKQYKLNDIKSCGPVTNSPLYGWGIKMLPNGWLYNVSGFKAIELTFKHSSKIIRIGTDKPDEVAENINKKLTQQKNGVVENVFKRSYHVFFFWGTIALTILFIVALFYYGAKDPDVKINTNSIEIKGMYGQTIYLNEIARVDTIPHLPIITSRTNGFAFGKSCKGHFRMAGNRPIMLFVKRGNPPYIYINYNQQNNLLINFNDPAKTRALFREIWAHVKK